jgi:hypothetical protein
MYGTPSALKHPSSGKSRLFRSFSSSHPRRASALVVSLAYGLIGSDGKHTVFMIVHISTEYISKEPLLC